MLGFGRKRRQWMKDVAASEHKARIELARAIVEQLTGDRREKALAKVAEAERRFALSE